MRDRPFARRQPGAAPALVGGEQRGGERLEEGAGFVLGQVQRGGAQRGHPFGADGEVGGRQQGPGGVAGLVAGRAQAPGGQRRVVVGDPAGLRQETFVGRDRGGLVGVADLAGRRQQPEQVAQVGQLQLAQGPLEMRIQRTGEGDHQVHGGGLSAFPRKAPHRAVIKLSSGPGNLWGHADRHAHGRRCLARTAWGRGGRGRLDPGAHGVDLRPAPGHARLPGAGLAGLPARGRVRAALPGRRHRRWLAAAPQLVLAAGPQRRGAEAAAQGAQGHPGDLRAGQP